MDRNAFSSQMTNISDKDKGLEPCFILNRRPYSETSLILDVFTETHGRISVLAKGARSPRSQLKGLLQPFTPLLMKWSGKGSMRTLHKAEAISLALPLSGLYLYSAMYINELVGRVIENETPYPALFHDYLFALTELARLAVPSLQYKPSSQDSPFSQEQDQAETETSFTASPEPALRRFELALLSALGYGVDFLHCAGSGEPVSDNMTYRYREQKGFIASVRQDNLTFLGNELIAISERRFLTKAQLQAAKRFTRMALKPFLGTKPLKSRELFVSQR